MNVSLQQLAVTPFLADAGCYAIVGPRASGKSVLLRKLLYSFSELETKILFCLNDDDQYEEHLQCIPKAHSCSPMVAHEYLQQNLLERKQKTQQQRHIIIFNTLRAKTTTDWRFIQILCRNARHLNCVVFLMAQTIVAIPHILRPHMNFILMATPVSLWEQKRWIEQCEQLGQMFLSGKWPAFTPIYLRLNPQSGSNHISYLSVKPDTYDYHITARPEWIHTIQDGTSLVSNITKMIAEYLNPALCCHQCFRMLRDIHFLNNVIQTESCAFS